MPVLTELAPEGVQELGARSGHARPCPDGSTRIKARTNAQTAHATIVSDGHDALAPKHARPRVHFVERARARLLLDE
eukprot:10163162-Alexandrium_andersonii.AAC.1